MGCCVDKEYLEYEWHNMPENSGLSLEQMKACSLVQMQEAQRRNSKLAVTQSVEEKSIEKSLDKENYIHGGYPLMNLRRLSTIKEEQSSNVDMNLLNSENAHSSLRVSHKQGIQFV